MPIVLCPDLRFRVHPFCGNLGGGLVQEKPEDRAALRKCKKKIPKQYRKKKGKKKREKRRRKELKGRKRLTKKSGKIFRSKVKRFLMGKYRFKRRKHLRKT